MSERGGCSSGGEGSDSLLPKYDLIDKLRIAREGDAKSREDILEMYKPLIGKITSNLCQRRLEWGRDDELSIGLIAFNEAIDRYKEDCRVPFPAYARIVVRSRLTDYFRKEARHNAANLQPFFNDGEQGENPAEIAKSWDNYYQEVAARESELEILQYEKMLSNYGISFDNLVKSSPKHRDSRLAQLQAARILASDTNLMQDLLTKKKLPIQELSLIAGIHRKTLERGRKYIIATALIFYYHEDFLYLSSYVNIPGSGKGES
ncbi:RNA polymerase sigma-I factor [Desulfofarcimen acetoxidans]|uniref:RNA polymerase sigma-I factor n=1 Tax=Desulfofarcimen acetoxidans TaxID=58138 RepID=UPI001F608527|nr:RNA polymerase sigma-I factor [Desulfofarcimen acetoxidans]